MMGPGQEGTWDKVAAPSNMGTYTSGDTPAGSKGSKGTDYKASANLSSSTGMDPDNKEGTYTSDQTTQSVNGANVKALSSITPDVNDVGSNAALWGGKGVGGY